jgi:hypothetical protein
MEIAFVNVSPMEKLFFELAGANLVTPLACGVFSGMVKLFGLLDLQLSARYARSRVLLQITRRPSLHHSPRMADQYSRVQGQ